MLRNSSNVNRTNGSPSLQTIDCTHQREFLSSVLPLRYWHSTICHLPSPAAFCPFAAHSIERLYFCTLHRNLHRSYRVTILASCYSILPQWRLSAYRSAAAHPNSILPLRFSAGTPVSHAILASFIPVWHCLRVFARPRSTTTHDNLWRLTSGFPEIIGIGTSVNAAIPTTGVACQSSQGARERRLAVSKSRDL